MLIQSMAFSLDWVSSLTQDVDELSSCTMLAIMCCLVTKDHGRVHTPSLHDAQ